MVGRTGYPEASRSMLALGPGVLGLLSFGLVAPAAWSVASGELKAIADGRRDPRRSKIARIALVLGIIGTVLLGLAVLAVLVIVVLSRQGDGLGRVFSEIESGLDG